MRNDLAISYDYGVTEIQEITDFESEVGFIFPLHYKELIMKHNGAQFEEDTFDFVSPVGNDERDCCFCSYGLALHERISERQLDESQCGLINLVVFARCANGDKICFDYRTNPTTDNPPVVVVFHDWWEEGADGVQRMLVCDVAKDFEAFVDLLYEDKDED